MKYFQEESCKPASVTPYEQKSGKVWTCHLGEWSWGADGTILIISSHLQRL